jgi:hypothetical protein
MMKKLLVIVLSLVFLFSVSSCHPRMAGNLIGAAIITTALVGTAMVMAEHDAHHHHTYCGCQRHYHEGHWVYYYGGHWEYYDEDHDAWYRYQSGPPHTPPPPPPPPHYHHY